MARAALTLSKPFSTTAAIRLRGKKGMRRRMRVLRTHGFRCHVCGLVRSETDLEADHVVPLHRGGIDDETNLKPICRRTCHKEKSDRERQGTV